MLYSMDIGCAQSQFSSTRPKNYFVLAIDFLQIFGHVQRSIRTAVINNNHLVLVSTTNGIDFNCYDI